MNRIFLLLISTSLLLQACGSSTPNADAPSTAPTNVEAANTTTEAPTSTLEPIVHTVIPQGGQKVRAYAHDNENSTTFENKNVRFGDEFQKNRFERPFTSVDMNYLPDIDILDFGITSDEQFFYISIILAGLQEGQTLPTGIYGVEIDRDADGRAELMLGTLPGYSTDFTAENVIVTADVNGDIGGNLINRPDENFESNGYEGIIFDLGQNIHPNDPDLAWVRVQSTQVGGVERPVIEIAYRKWIFRGGNETFMWSVYAISGEQGLDTSRFNLHDVIAEAAAGSPDQNNPAYPIRELAAIDNTCRVPLGFEAAGSEPLGCQVGASEPEIEENVPEFAGGSTPDSPFCDAFTEVCKRTPPVVAIGNNGVIKPPVFFVVSTPSN